MSPAVRTVGPMTNQVQITVAHDVLDEPCPRCESTAVRVVSSSVDVVIEADAAADPFAGESPLFDCRECGFEWGELVRDLMR
jgi:hypothetical protein